MQEVLLHGLLIKIRSSLEALQFFTVTVLQAFTAREKERFNITLKKKKEKENERETVSG